MKPDMPLFGRNSQGSGYQKDQESSSPRRTDVSQKSRCAAATPRSEHTRTGPRPPACGSRSFVNLLHIPTPHSPAGDLHSSASAQADMIEMAFIAALIVHGWIPLGLMADDPPLKQNVVERKPPKMISGAVHRFQPGKVHKHVQRDDAKHVLDNIDDRIPGRCMPLCRGPEHTMGRLSRYETAMPKHIGYRYRRFVTTNSSAGRVQSITPMPC